jgi:hypothetical protein
MQPKILIQAPLTVVAGSGNPVIRVMVLSRSALSIGNERSTSFTVTVRVCVIISTTKEVKWDILGRQGFRAGKPQSSLQMGNFK